MFVALRDLRFAKGRFALIALVVALMMLLVGFVSGLAGGLGAKNVSALLDTGAERVVFAMPNGAAASYAESQIDEAQLDAWRATGAEVAPLGISNARLERVGDANPSVARSDDATDAAPAALFGGDAGWLGRVPLADGEVALGASTAAKLGVAAGDRVSASGVELEVASVIADADYSHLAVAYATRPTQAELLDATRQPHGVASVLLVKGDVDAGAADAAAGTESQALLPSLLAIESFKAELGSLGLMVAMLMLASVLVVGVFFLVWSIQRQRDVAVLKALGAGDGWLRGDAIGQAALILLLGVGAGTAATLGLGAIAGGKVPFLASWLTIGLPAAGMLLAGLLGSLASLRQITKADPLAALAAA